MHDELSQKATVLALEFSLLGMEIDKPKGFPPKALKAKIKELCAVTVELGDAIRDITNCLHPKVLDEFGLVAALQWLVKLIQKDIPCALVAPEIVLPAPLSNELFGLAEAVVSHILRPAQPASVDIRLEQREGLVMLRISGEHKKPLSQSSADSALDWLSVQERALRIGATVKINTVTGVGSTVSIAVPVKSETVSLPPKKRYAANTDH